MIPPDLSSDWLDLLHDEAQKTYFLDLQGFVANERAMHSIFPPPDQVFEAFRLCPLEKTQVVILGQDPYHGPGQAHGLSFSVRHGVPVPPSLRNILQELENDLGIPRPKHGCLTAWAEQGVLLLNTILTVREGEPGSHRGRGWERLTDRVIRDISERLDHVVFVLWGRFAQSQRHSIDCSRHQVIESAHPSPLSARGFFGTRPFSRINQILNRWGRPPIDWRLPER